MQISKSRPRGEEEDYGPPDSGYWPPRFPVDRPEPPGYPRGRFGYPPGPPPPPPPMPPRRPPYPERAAPAYERERGVVDYYEKYRARPYGAASYEDRRPGAIPPPPPPPSSGIMRERLAGNGLDPYERRPLPPPPSSYYARDRSPIRRAPPAPQAPAGNGYSFERSRLSPLTMSRTPMYNMPRARDPYADRLAPPPPPARYSY